MDTSTRTPLFIFGYSLARPGVSHGPRMALLVAAILVTSPTLTVAAIIRTLMTGAILSEHRGIVRRRPDPEIAQLPPDVAPESEWRNRA
jgi:hypothetical protein